MATPILGKAPPLAGVPKSAWASSLVQRLKTRSAPKVIIGLVPAGDACTTGREVASGAQNLKRSMWLSALAAWLRPVYRRVHLRSCASGSFAACHRAGAMTIATETLR